MPKQLQCPQGHRWETGIGREGQVPLMIPNCPMCGAPPLRQWRDWQNLSPAARIVILSILVLLPLGIFGILFYYHLHQRLVRDTLEGHDSPVTAVAFADQGNLLASGSEDGTVKIWDLSRGKEKETLSAQKGGIVAVGFPPGSGKVALASQGGTIQSWNINVSGGKVDSTDRFPAPVVAAAFAPDGKSTAVACANQQVLLNGTSLQHQEGVTSVAYSPDSDLLGVGTEKGTVTLWHVARKKRFAVCDGKAGPVTTLAFAPDRRTFAMATADGNLVLWDALTGRRHHTWKGHQGAVPALCFSPAKMLLASASRDGTVKLWEIVDDHFKERSACRDFPGDISSLAFSPDGQTLALGSTNHSILLWNVAGLLKYGPEG